MDFSYLSRWRKRAFERTGGRGRFLDFLFQEPNEKNDIVFDLHTHTVGSDGVRNAKMLGHEAQANGVKMLSVTDHDSLSTIDELFYGRSNLADYTGEFVAGVEITSRLNGECVEVLLYDYDYEKLKSPEMKKEFPFLERSFRLERILTLIQRRIDIVNKLGLTDKPLSLNDFVSLEIENDKGVVENIPFAALGLDVSQAIDFKARPLKIQEEIAVNGKSYKVNFDYFNSKLFRYIKNSQNGSKFLSEFECGSQKEITNFSEFNRFLIQRTDSPLFVDDQEFWPTVAEISDFAKKVGGVAILAHPYGYGNLDVTPEQLMKQALAAGVDGIECMHGFNEPDEVEKIYKFCFENDLLFTAGSDTHDFYSQQGNLTEVGRSPSQGVKSKFKDNALEDVKIRLYNVHHFGTGAWRGEKSFDVDSKFNFQK